MEKQSGGKKATLKELFIQFQIEVKSKEIEEFNEEIKELEAKKQQFTELQDQLREEHQRHLTVLQIESNKQDKKLKEKKIANKEELEQAAKRNVELAHIQEEELAELRRQLRSLQALAEEPQGQWETWLLYKNVGSVEHQKQIQKIKSELVTMQKTFQAIPESIESSLKATMSKIDKNVSLLVEGEMWLARERALKQVDNHSVEKIKKNHWLKKEFVIYHEELSILDEAVKNLEHLKQQFEQGLDDAQTSGAVLS